MTLTAPTPARCLKAPFLETTALLVTGVLFASAAFLQSRRATTNATTAGRAAQQHAAICMRLCKGASAEEHKMASSATRINKLQVRQSSDAVVPKAVVRSAVRAAQLLDDLLYLLRRVQPELLRPLPPARRMARCLLWGTMG